MDKDIITLYTELQKNRYQQSLMPALNKIPKIIAKYEGREEFEDELEELIDFHQQILFIEEESRKYIQALEEGLNRGF
jgi:hypothetical protein